MPDPLIASADRTVDAPDLGTNRADQAPGWPSRPQYQADQAARSTDQVRQLFDAKAATWAVKYAPDGQLAYRVGQFAWALCHYVPDEGRVLDLGCGTGDLARALTASGWPVTGCDISEQMLEHAVAGDQEGMVEWVRLDPGWRTLPFAPASFDAVVAASVLEYVDSPAEVLRECARVLRPGGVVLCTVPDTAHPIRWLEWLAAVAGRLPRIRNAGDSWPLLGAYLAYLRVSRQRHTARWWHQAADFAKLKPVHCPADLARRSRRRPPLRMHVFRAPGDVITELR